MQTHDEGEPWHDYVPPLPRPTADLTLVKIQYNYARLHQAAIALVEYWESIGSPRDERDYCNVDRVTELMDKMASLLREGEHP